MASGFHFEEIGHARNTVIFGEINFASLNSLRISHTLSSILRNEIPNLTRETNISVNLEIGALIGEHFSEDTFILLDEIILLALDTSKRGISNCDGVVVISETILGESELLAGGGGNVGGRVGENEGRIEALVALEDLGLE